MRSRRFHPLFKLLLSALLGVTSLSSGPGFIRSAAAQHRVADPESLEMEQLLLDANTLMNSSKPLGARSKLEEAIRLKPNDFRPYLFLSEYYLTKVGHFTLSYRYALRAEEIFLKTFGNPPKQEREKQMFALLLELKAEAELNLDKYEQSLKTLNRVPLEAASTSFPGSKAWVLMKLKRLEEAIGVARAGLLAQADPQRTYNVLGILLSLNGQRELSLQAFANAMKPDLLDGLLANIATPLNNAGEVYREMFNERAAEAAWLRSTSMKDGCEHVLPSLNLSILYTDEIRLKAADETLNSFEKCFAETQSREDTEHRALLALGRGKIALRRGDPDLAINLLTQALEREQWFGKIGTNENDLRFAATIGLAQALRAKASCLLDTQSSSWRESANNLLLRQQYLLRAWWLLGKARNEGRNELEDFEDLTLRNTDTMVEYPTLGALLEGYSPASVRARVRRLEKEDKRSEARVYYRTYLADNLLAHGQYSEARGLLEAVYNSLRPVDKLLRAQVISSLLLALEAERYFWQSPGTAEKIRETKLKEELFQLLPSQLRYSNLRLPVRLVSDSSRLSRILSSRFEYVEQGESDYELSIKENSSATDGRTLELSLRNVPRQQLIAGETGKLQESAETEASLINKFIASAFSHKVDPPADPLPKLELLQGIL